MSNSKYIKTDGKNKVLEYVEKTYGTIDKERQIYNFIKYLFNREWFRPNQLVIDWIDDIYEDGLWCIGHKNKVYIGFRSIYDKDGKISKLSVGIDPVYCWEKITKCSILATLPLQQNSIDEFYTKLYSILYGDEKDEWYKKACECWCGDYAMFK